MDKVVIAGIEVTPLKIVSTPGGDVFHGIKASDAGFCGFGEAYFSTIQPSIIKPWKRHNRMTLNLVVIVGCIRFVVHDDRAGSPTQGLTESYVLGPHTNYCRLTVPPGVWMAFQGLSDTHSILLNVTDIPHDPTEVDRRTLGEIDYPWGIQ